MGPGTTFNLFLPFNRGGLGFQEVPGLRPRITSFQRRYSSFLEKELLQQMEDGRLPTDGFLGLVTKKSVSGGILPIQHHPSLRLDPLIGPLEKGVVEYTPRVYAPPALSQPMDPERPDLIVRFPKKSMMKKFRSSTLRRMSTKEISSWPFRLTERVQDLSVVLENRVEEPFDLELALWASEEL